MEAIWRMMIVCCAEASFQIYPKGQKRCKLPHLQIHLRVRHKVPNLYTVSLVLLKPVQRWWWFGQQRSHSTPFHQCFWNKLVSDLEYPDILLGPAGLDAGQINWKNRCPFQPDAQKFSCPSPCSPQTHPNLRASQLPVILMSVWAVSPRPATPARGPRLLTHSKSFGHGS